MIAVAITGSYASGKTFTLNYLADRGFKTFSADKCVKNLYQNSEIQNKVLTLLPDLEAFDRAKIVELIYNNDVARGKLQDFIHPFVREQVDIFKKQHQSENFIFAEIPLLFETGFNKNFDFYITTFCKEETRIKRASAREHFDLKIYNKIAQIQLPQQMKIEKADFIINTDANLLEFDDQIINLIKKLECNHFVK